MTSSSPVFFVQFVESVENMSIKIGSGSLRSLSQVQKTREQHTIDPCKKTMSHHPTYTMAALLGAGGLFGYAKTKSVPSLVAGVTLGAGFGLAGYLLQSGNMTQGHGVALFASTITMSAMGVRAIKSRKPLPIAISSLGAVSAAYHAQKFTEWIGQE